MSNSTVQYVCPTLFVLAVLGKWEIGVDTAEDVEVLWEQMGSISLLRSKLTH